MKKLEIVRSVRFLCATMVIEIIPIFHHKFSFFFHMVHQGISIKALYHFSFHNIYFREPPCSTPQGGFTMLFIRVFRQTLYHFTGFVVQCNAMRGIRQFAWFCKNHAPLLSCLGVSDLEFIVLKDSNRGFIVKRKNGKYEEHAHLKTMNGCRQLLYYIKKGMLPKSEYLQGSCRRLLSETEYDSLKKPKDRYYNRGGRKVEKR